MHLGRPELVELANNCYERIIISVGVEVQIGCLRVQDKCNRAENEGYDSEYAISHLPGLGVCGSIDGLNGLNKQDNSGTCIGSSSPSYEKKEESSNRTKEKRAKVFYKSKPRRSIIAIAQTALRIEKVAINFGMDQNGHIRFVNNLKGREQYREKTLGAVLFLLLSSCEPCLFIQVITAHMVDLGALPSEPRTQGNCNQLAPILFTRREYAVGSTHRKIYLRESDICSAANSIYIAILRLHSLKKYPTKVGH